MYDFLFLSLYRHLINQGISKQIQCAWTFTVLIQSNHHHLEGRREREKEDRKNAKRGNKSNIELELCNFRYHINCYWDFVIKLQINTIKSTHDHKRSDKAPFNFTLKSILNKESKIWNTNKLLDAFRNKGISESNSTHLVNTSCLIENIDWWGYITQNGIPTSFQDLSHKSRLAEH